MAIPVFAREAAPLLSPNLAGEMFRELAFKEEYGCHSCFDLIDGFEPIDPAELEEDALVALLGCFSRDPKCIQEVSAYRDRGGVIVAWHWDGDGTLLFQDGDLMLYNTDCKHRDEWERRGDKDCWVTGYWADAA